MTQATQYLRDAATQLHTLSDPDIEVVRDDSEEQNIIDKTTISFLKAEGLQLGLGYV